MRPSLLSALTSWLAAGGREIGQAVIIPEGTGWLLCHADDAALAGTGRLTRHTTPEAARDTGRYDAAGEFRPLRSAPTLAGGWEIALATNAELLLALDFLYPAAVGNWVHHMSGELPAGTLRATLGRQTGIYRVTALIRDEEIDTLVSKVCEGGCLRRILWPVDEARSLAHLPACRQPAASPSPAEGKPIPLLCTDACPLLIGGARTAVKARMSREAATS